MVSLCDIIDGANLSYAWGEACLDLSGTTNVEWAQERNAELMGGNRKFKSALVGSVCVIFSRKCELLDYFQAPSFSNHDAGRPVEIMHYTSFIIWQWDACKVPLQPPIVEPNSHRTNSPPFLCALGVL